MDPKNSDPLNSATSPIPDLGSSLATTNTESTADAGSLSSSLPVTPEPANNPPAEPISPPTPPAPDLVTSSSPLGGFSSGTPLAGDTASVSEPKVSAGTPDVPVTGSSLPSFDSSSTEASTAPPWASPSSSGDSLSWSAPQSLSTPGSPPAEGNSWETPSFSEPPTPPQDTGQDLTIGSSSSQPSADSAGFGSLPSPLAPPSLDNAGIPPAPSNNPSDMNTPMNTPAFGSNTPPGAASSNPSSFEEATPTDLSHLVGDSQGSNAGPAPVSQPETLVMPATTPTAQVVTSTHGSFPTWILLVGAFIMLLVIGGSAYFILGIGRPAQTPVGIQPIVQPAVVPQVASPTPIVATPTVSSTNLPGSQTPGTLGVSPTSSATGSSALELLRLRQGR